MLASSYNMDDIPLVREQQASFDVSERNRMLQGCTFIEDALNFRLTYHKVDLRSLKVYRLYHSRYVQWSINVILVVIHLLIFFEPPSSISVTADIRSGAKRVEVPPYVLLPIEGICLLLLSFDCFIKIYSFGVRQIRSYPWHLGYALCLIASFVGWFMVLVWPGCGIYCKWRCLLRPAFLIQHSSLIKKALKCLIKALPSISSVILLIVLHVLLFTLIGLALFPSDKGPVQFDPVAAEGEKYFSTASVALINMIVLLTTSNNPNIMTKAYNENRFYSVFFIIYVGIGIYCFLNILLAVVFQQFREYFKESMRHRILRRRAGLVAAFQVLSDVDLQTGKRSIPARRLSVVLSSLILKPEVKSNIHDRFVQELKFCQDNSGGDHDVLDVNIHWKQFFKRIFGIGIGIRRQKYADNMRAAVTDPLTTSVQENVARYSPTTDGETEVGSGNTRSAMPKIFRKMVVGLRYVLAHSFFIHFGSLVTVVNVVLIIIQTSDDDRKTSIEAPSFGFIAYYAVEQVGILWAVCPKNYIKRWLHRVDFFFTVLIALSTITFFIVDALVSSEVSVARYATVGITHILSGCRLGRVVLSLKLPNLIVRTMADLLVNLTPFLGLLMAQYYFFAVLGMMLFEGAIEYTPQMDGCWHWDDNSSFSLACRPANATRCIYGDDFHSSEFWAENFNDFASSIVVLWNLMVVNNWNVLLEAYSNASSGAAQVYFISWYILTVLICLDLFIAVIVENFNTRWNVFSEEKQRRQAQEKLLADAAAGKRPSVLQARVSNRERGISRRRRTRTQSQPMRLAYILGVEAPNMELVRMHLASNPYYPAEYADDPDDFLGVYDTESEDEDRHNTTDDDNQNAVEVESASEGFASPKPNRLADP